MAVGAVLPLTGPVAQFGESAKTGIDLALSEINTSGRRFKLRVLFEDDGGRVETAVSAVHKLITVDRVPLIIGAAGSNLSLAIAPIASRRQVVLFSPMSSAAELTHQGGEFFFRVWPSDAFEARELANWLIEQNLSTAAVVFTGNGWGASRKEEFLTSYKKLGGGVLAVEVNYESRYDFRSQLAGLTRTGPKAIVAFTSAAEGGALLRQARELGISVPIFGVATWDSTEFLAAAGDSAEGALFTSLRLPTGDRFARFAGKYHTRYGTEPDMYASYAYDLVHILTQVFEDGARSGPELRDSLRRMPAYEGVTGRIQFDQHGDTTAKSLSRQVIRGGRTIPVDSEGARSRSHATSSN